MEDEHEGAVTGDGGIRVGYILTGEEQVVNLSATGEAGAGDSYLGSGRTPGRVYGYIGEVKVCSAANIKIDKCNKVVGAIITRDIDGVTTWRHSGSRRHC